MNRFPYLSLLLTLAVAGFTTAAPPELKELDEEYTGLLQKYVRENGVAYAAWKAHAADAAALDTYLQGLGALDPAALSEDAQIAFHINLYNAAMIQAVLQHYPLSSVTDILPNFGIFDKDFIALNGAVRSLNYVEKEVLLTRWSDPRIHFAVNCASFSCPPLRAEAFTASKLETQLEEQTRIFANSTEAARTTFGSVQVSALFNWYSEDFPGDNPVAYLNQYRKEKLSTRKRLAFLDYNWSLNEAQ